MSSKRRRQQKHTLLHAAINFGLRPPFQVLGELSLMWWYHVVSIIVVTGLAQWMRRF
jgi:hypothetical protein